MATYENDTNTQIDSKDDKDILKLVHDCYRESTDFLSRSHGNMTGWLEETEKSFRYASGDPWEMADYQAMKHTKRAAPLSFNRIDPFLDAVLGAAINNDTEIKFFARNSDNPGFDEFSTGVFEYVRDCGEMQEEEFEAFRNLLLCGMGWTGAAVDYRANLDGEVDLVNKDPRRMRWDPTASRKNLKDADWLLCVEDMPPEDIEAQWGKVPTNYYNPWDKDIDNLGMTGYSIQATDYERGYGGQRYKARRIEHVGIYQFRKYETVYRFATPDGVKTITKEQHAKVSKDLAARGIRAIRQKQHKIHQYVVCGDQVLYNGPALEDFDYSYHPMTGKYDRIAGFWYGLVRPLFDPTDWFNKFLSTIIYTVATAPKGGIMAELGAFADPREVERKWARADSIIYTNDGALSNGRVQPKPVGGLPPGLMDLIGITDDAFTQVAGISPEMMGLSDRFQAGIVENQRSTSSVSLLAWAFNSLRSYRKRSAKYLIAVIRDYIGDGRLVRISGKEGDQFLQLFKDKMSLEYDVVADESPSAPNVKERTWAVLSTIIPQFLQIGYPVPPEIVDYMPIPESLKQAWKKQITPPPPDPQQEALKQQAAQLALKQQEVQVIEGQSKAELNQAKVQEIAQKLGITEQEVRRMLFEAYQKGATDSQQTLLQ